jgi:hypothetical protein
VLLDLHQQRPVGQAAEDQCRPAGTLGADGGLAEFLLEAIEAAEFAVDGLGDKAMGLGRGLGDRGQVFPEQRMQEVAGGIEREGFAQGLGVAVDAFAAVLVQRFQDGVGPVDISGMMLLMVQLQLCLRDEWLQVFIAKFQFWKLIGSFLHVNTKKYLFVAVISIEKWKKNVK